MVFTQNDMHFARTLLIAEKNKDLVKVLRNGCMVYEIPSTKFKNIPDTSSMCVPNSIHYFIIAARASSTTISDVWHPQVFF